MFLFKTKKFLLFVIELHIIKKSFKIAPLVIFSCRNPFILKFLLLKLCRFFGKIFSYSSLRKYSIENQYYGLIVRFIHIHQALIVVFFLNDLKIFEEKINVKILKNVFSWNKFYFDLTPQIKYPLIKFKKKKNSSGVSILYNNFKKFCPCSTERKTYFTPILPISYQIIRFFNPQNVEYCFQATDGEFVNSKRVNLKIEKRKFLFKEKIFHFLKKNGYLTFKTLTEIGSYFETSFFLLGIGGRENFLDEIFEIFFGSNAFIKTKVKIKNNTLIYIHISKEGKSWLVLKHGFFFSEINSVKIIKKNLLKNV
mmetsp:Transcript_39350/g.78868  ORF Transcript_39350/g.78868 Transcript_39350/m.78868 type:complete len:310 (-) Transcript_39350:3901-4830(-)